MNIRRKTEEFGLPKGVIEIELTSEEIEQAFRIREREYLIADIENAVQEAYENEQISEEEYLKAKNNKEVLAAIAERYEKTCSCNVAYNVTMEEAVKEILKNSEVQE